MGITADIRPELIENHMRFSLFLFAAFFLTFGITELFKQGEDAIAQQILVAYATKYGATAEIAQKISDALNKAGLKTGLRNVKDIRNIEGYQAVVLGSGFYIGRWRREAARFLKKNEKSLAAVPVWLFSSGPTGKDDAEKIAEGWCFPKGLQRVADRIRVRDKALFHGSIDMSKLSAIEKWMIGKVGAPVGDFRNWKAITAWAEAIAKELK